MNINDAIEKTKLYIIQNPCDTIFNVAILAQQILNEISKIIKPGISELQATDEANLIFKKNGIEKLWHRPLIRFNQNTLCTFKDRTLKNYTLQEEDIAFIDIGIIKDGIEGDVGKTMVFGYNKEFIRLKNISEILFQNAIRYWQAKNPTGIKLYEFIYTQAKKT